MVDIVRCDRPSGKAVPIPRPQCIEPGCTRPQKARGRCNACYCRWYASPDFEPVPRKVYDPEACLSWKTCPWCGPYRSTLGTSSGICPTCGLDAAEVRYAERIMADSDAVYRQELAEFNARRRKGGK